MSVALPPYVRHGHCISFFFFQKLAGILQQLEKRENQQHSRSIYLHLATNGDVLNKWRDESLPPAGWAFILPWKPIHYLLVVIIVINVVIRWEMNE